MFFFYFLLPLLVSDLYVSLRCCNKFCWRPRVNLLCFIPPCNIQHSAYSGHCLWGRVGVFIAFSHNPNTFSNLDSCHRKLKTSILFFAATPPQQVLIVVYFPFWSILREAYEKMFTMMMHAESTIRDTNKSKLWCQRLWSAGWGIKQLVAKSAKRWWSAVTRTR